MLCSMFSVCVLSFRPSILCHLSAFHSPTQTDPEPAAWQPLGFICCCCCCCIMCWPQCSSNPSVTVPALAACALSEQTDSASREHLLQLLSCRIVYFIVFPGIMDVFALDQQPNLLQHGREDVLITE